MCVNIQTLVLVSFRPTCIFLKLFRQLQVITGKFMFHDFFFCSFKIERRKKNPHTPESLESLLLSSHQPCCLQVPSFCLPLLGAHEVENEAPRGLRDDPQWNCSCADVKCVTVCSFFFFSLRFDCSFIEICESCSRLNVTLDGFQPVLVQFSYELTSSDRRRTQNRRIIDAVVKT